MMRKKVNVGETMNNEIEVGDYVRYKEGTISKVLDINKDETFDLLCENFTLSSKFIVKHSKNKIDIVEERRLR